MKTFADTSGLYAVLDRDDRFHLEAAEAWRRLLERGARLTTSSYVLCESFALVQARLGMEAVRDLHRVISSSIEVVWVDPGTHARAVEILFGEDRRRLSLVDCVSFTIMRQLAIEEAFTFDRHFEEFGFRSVLPPARR